MSDAGYHARVADLLKHCPFLAAPLREVQLLDEEDFALATVIFGGTATLLKEHRLPPEQEDAVFAYFNGLAERADTEDREILGIGALELFNDDAASQRVARAKLTGSALAMLEEFRVSWGQPDYGRAP
ncbi:hypothetical protein IAG41_20645 [Sphingomonas sp. JC676]|uniref:hypothetical protein n=1 Tax=Sphingomonas sp. JC676 TaxID=2768065 RepID=UPI0016579362|nr:hypothetical protein [Sphingomonas sp. JC676]MBC9034807.1 hypothetical protein [Sphingomonas sp. JC676]